MYQPDHLLYSIDDERLCAFVQGLLDTVKEQSAQIEKQVEQIGRLVRENEQLRAEIRHLKKHKGKPKIRPNVATQDDQDSEAHESGESCKDATSKRNHNSPPKSKRSRPKTSGETAAPPVVVTREETCTIANPGQDWRFKGYTHFHHTELVLKFETTLYRRLYYQTPEGTVMAPLPEHVKGRFGDNLKAHLLNFYHSCSTTQPLMLAWLHDHDCPISAGTLNKILTEGHDPFHEEKDEILEASLSLFDYLQADDTGARHKEKSGYCLFVGSPLFAYFHSSESKSRTNFLSVLLGQNALYNDIDAYRKNPTEAQKRRLAMDFDHWITTQVDYPELQKVLGQLMVVRDELLLVLEYPWLPMHNNLSERKIREYVKQRKVSGGTRSTLERKCRDSFASLKKTCKLRGISFAHYLKDRISGLKKIPRLGELVLAAATGQKVASA